MNRVPAAGRRAMESFFQSCTEESLKQLEPYLKIIEGKLPAWKGPFAWSILITIQSREHLNGTLAEAAWSSCQVVHCMEEQLTLKPYDFDRLLCTLVGNFIHASEFTWACCICSLLYERLCAAARPANLTEEFEKLALGGDFLRIIPRIILNNPNKLDPTLVITCQSLWLHLQSVRENCELEMIQTLLFDTGGILTILTKTCSKTQLKAIDIFMYHWRQSVINLFKLSADTPIFEIESKVLQRLPEWYTSSEEYRYSRWKSFVSYVAVRFSDGLKVLWDFDIASFDHADRYLGRLEGIPSENLIKCCSWTSLDDTSRTIIQLIAHAKDYDKTIFCHPSCTLSTSVELWTVQLCGRMLKHNPNSAISILSFLNCLSIIRHVRMPNISPIDYFYRRFL